MNENSTETGARPTEPDGVRDDRYYVMEAPMGRALVHLAVPMMAAVSVGIVYNIVNAGFVGSLGSTPLLAALTFGLPLTALVMAIGGMFGAGGSAAIGLLLGEMETAEPGARDALGERLRHTAAFAIWGGVVLGAVVALAGLVGIDALTGLLGASGEAFAPTRTYAQVLLIGTPVMVTAFALEQLVRAEGASRASMTAIIASTAANFLFDVLFILVLRWDVAGAAWALVLSNVVTIASLALHLRRSGSAISLSPRWFSPDLATARAVLGIGVSELLMSVFLLVSSLMFNNVAVIYGDAVIAGFGVAQRIVQVPEMLAMGVSMGVMPIIASATGARHQDRVVVALRHGACWIAACVAVFALPMFVFGSGALTPFSTDPQVLSIGALALTAQLVAALFNGFTALAIVYCQATGSATRATVLSVVQGGLFIPALLIGHAAWGLPGVVWAMTVAEVLTFTLAVVVVLTGLRRSGVETRRDAVVPALA